MWDPPAAWTGNPQRVSRGPQGTGAALLRGAAARDPWSSVYLCACVHMCERVCACESVLPARGPGRYGSLRGRPPHLLLVPLPPARLLGAQKFADRGAVRWACSFSKMKVSVREKWELPEGKVVVNTSEARRTLCTGVGTREPRQSWRPWGGSYGLGRWRKQVV